VGSCACSRYDNNAAIIIIAIFIAIFIAIYLLRCVNDTGVVSVLEGRAESGRRDSERQSSIETLQQRSIAIVNYDASEKLERFIAMFRPTISRRRNERACARTTHVTREREKESDKLNVNKFK